MSKLELSNKIQVADLVQIAVAKGVRNAVVSPGSRNAPLVISLDRHPDITCHVVVDERSAAFVALGMAQQLNAPVLLTCTSGSAALNYAPAVAEAYYQRIPLVLLTADRPEEWIDQDDGQTIRQQNVYGKHVRGSYHLPQEPLDDDRRWQMQRTVNEAFAIANEGSVKGPVHINVPLREPLYGTAVVAAAPKIIHTYKTNIDLPASTIRSLQQEWKQSKKKMILVGTHPPDATMHKAISALANDPSCVVLTETISNLHGIGLPCIDRIIFGLEQDIPEKMAPDLLVTFGGPVVSKKIKAILRKVRPEHHWHIDPDEPHMDTYQSLTAAIKCTPESFFTPFVDGLSAQSEGYAAQWQQRHTVVAEEHAAFMTSCVWSDLKAFECIANHLPAEQIVHLGNSTPVRYAQLVEHQAPQHWLANRGTSGIDGSTSTAVGAALTTNKIVTVITGDLSFVYDSNALWNECLPGNLRIVLVNNGGGGIFSIIPGPPSTAQHQRFFNTHQHVNMQSLVEAFGVDYSKANSVAALEAALQRIYAADFNTAAVVEIDTLEADNAAVLKAYIGAMH